VTRSHACAWVCVEAASGSKSLCVLKQSNIARCGVYIASASGHRWWRAVYFLNACDINKICKIYWRSQYIL